MSIYPDKKDGKLTGRFRVEVQGRYMRYRARCDSIGEARSKDIEFRTMAEAGSPPPPRSTSVGGRPRRATERLGGPSATHQPSLMLSEARNKAPGSVWTGEHEKNCLNQLRIMEEIMGDVALNDIDTEWCLRLRKSLKDQRKMADGTANRYLACLSAFLKWALKANHRTVATMPDMDFKKEAEGRIRWITREEETVLLDKLPERSSKLVRLAILTGMRRGELLPLTPDQIHETRITLWGDGTKSGKSRTIPLRPEGYALAKWLVLEGHMPTQQMLRKDWAKARAAMKMEDDPEFVFHACRHTFATRAVDAGVPIRTLQQWLGHETIEMTEKYGKVTGAALNSAMDLMFDQAA
jgi:integrase